jgi:hypothetical protein
MSNWIGLATSIAVVVLLVVCVSLAWALRRLAAIQTQLDSHSSAIDSLELAHQGLLVRFMNLPRSRKARKSSGPWSDTFDEKMKAPTQPADKNFRGSALYIDAPKTSSE